MNKPNFSIIYFLLYFTILYYGFYIYVGITTPDGRLYASFLHNYFNVPYWLSIIVTKGSELFLQIMGYDVYQKNPVNVTIRGSSGANIAWGCIGVGVLVVWFSFVAAHRADIKYKLKWIVWGVGLIFLFNIIRISIIILSYYYNWAYFKSFNAHSTFNNITYVIIFILMIIFVIRFNRKEKRKSALDKTMKAKPGD